MINRTLPEILEHWKSFQCPNCQKGDRSKCETTEENAKAVRIDAQGKKHYYCFIGCLMLDLNDEERIKFIESQFNEEGHYEQARNSMYNQNL